MTRDERIRSFIDGELTEREAETLLAEAERDAELAAALDSASALQRSLVTLRGDDDARAPGDLVDRSVRRAVLERERDEAATRGVARLTRWFVRPRVFRVRPAALVLAVAAGVVLALGAARLIARVDPESLAASRVGADDERSAANEREDLAVAEVPVRFVLPARGARSVVVAGDFNEWRTDATQLVDVDGDGVFVGTVSLARGTYDYMFFVDGERWVADPYASQYHDDGFGQRNAVLRLD